MPHKFNTPFRIQLKSKNPPEEIKIQQGPFNLRSLGYNMLVQVSLASILEKQNLDKPIKPFIVSAHLDTGASVTTIDMNLAKHIELYSVGESPIKTASDMVVTSDYAVNISFVNSPLKAIENLRVSSCNLRTNLQECIKEEYRHENMGLLIGRDIMSGWNITWHGPSSSVFISD